MTVWSSAVARYVVERFGFLRYGMVLFRRLRRVSVVERLQHSCKPQPFRWFLEDITG